MKIRKFIIFLIALSGSVPAFCQYNNLEFVENKGQWEQQVRYRGNFTSGAFFLTQNGFRVLQSDPRDLQAVADHFHGNLSASQKVSASLKEPSVVIHSHAYDVQFANANTPVIIPDKPLDTYNNYFIGNDHDKWKGNCHIFQAVTYGEMYKGIDVRYYTDNGLLKYDIIVHPGGNVSAIAMKYDGANALQVKNGQLVVKTSLGNNKEMEPYTFQVINGQKKEVKCRFNVSGNIVRFDVEGYDKNATLVIDPTLIFSTLTGSTEDNWGYTATYAPDGSFFAGGIVFGMGFPVSIGAFQTHWGSGVNEGILTGYDIAIIKFDPKGVNRIFATYIGGSGNEQPHSMIADAQGDLVIAGHTLSGESYPEKNGPLIGPGGGYDIVITELNAAGSDLIGSRRIGGTGMDGTNIGPKDVSQNPADDGELSIRQNYGDDARSEVIFDNSGNILLGSNTRSVDFPIQSAFQNTLTGAQDGAFIKMSHDLSTLLVSSYLGGSGDDAVFVLAVNPIDNNIYLGGNTTSSNLPGDTTGVLQTKFAGNTDGFVSILTNGGTTLQKTCYLGTPGIDMLYGIQFDRFGFPYIMGSSRNGWVVKNAVFSETGGKQFISKLKPDLSDYVYSTIFGTNSTIPNISPVAFLVDRCENVYVSGWGGGVNTQSRFESAGTIGLATTADAIQRTTDGSDFYFFVLEKNAKSRLYASFFGQNGGVGEHVDGGTSRFDKNGVVYQAICANCGGGTGATFPTTPGAWSRINGSSNCNLAAVKIAFNLTGIANAIKSSIAGSVHDTVGCVPLRVDFRDTLAEGVKYIWLYGDGSRSDTTSVPSTNHVFTDTGVYRITLVSIDSSKCNIEDTSRTFINVKTFQAFLDFDWQKQLPCDSFKYLFNNKSGVVPAAIAFGSASFVWNFGDGSPDVVAGLNSVLHSFPAAGTYNVTLSLVDTNFCNAPLQLVKTLKIADIVKAGIETKETGCVPYNAAFSNTTIAGETFLWYFGDGDTSTLENPGHIYTVPGTYTIRLYAYNPGACNKTDSTTFEIIVSSAPVAGFIFSPNPPQVNTPVDFTNTSVNADWFLWKFGDGDSLLKNNVQPVQHLYNKSQQFDACLYAYNKAGCSDTVCQQVAARVLPLLDVPNGFTPNSDGNNDKVFVRGFGIVRMLWRIYNRWGTLIFETTDRNQGWDGRYKGSIQPMEVYHYTLDVGYSDNSTVQKQGDITLIR